MASLLPQQIDLLERLVEASRRAEKREPFMAVRTFDGDSLQHPGLDSTEVYFSDLEVLADRGLLHVGHVGQHEMTFDVSPEGFEFVVDQDASGQVAAFFHVEAELAETDKWDYEMDLTVDQAMGVWARYESGQRFSVNGRMLVQSDVSRLRIVATRQTSEQLRSLVAEEHKRIKLTDMQHPWQWHIMERGQSVTRQFSEARRAEEDAAPGGADQAADRRVVFVVHGRNDGARKAMFEFLRSIDLRPLEWSQAVNATGEAAPYVGQVLDAAFSKAKAVVVLMTPDDEAHLRSSFRKANEPLHETEFTPQARANVLFEAGMAMGRSPSRTVLVELGELRPFSDVGGRHAVRIDNTGERRHDLASRLETAGCAVDISGSDWLTAGDFDVALG